MAEQIRIKIFVDKNSFVLESAYNQFAETHDIVASQYKMTTDYFSICIWYKWDATTATYDEVKNDPKLMGDEE